MLILLHVIFEVLGVLRVLVVVMLGVGALGVLVVLEHTGVSGGPWFTLSLQVDKIIVK